MALSKQQFVPHADDLEFTGRFVHFGWPGTIIGVGATLLLLLLLARQFEAPLPSSQPLDSRLAIAAQLDLALANPARVKLILLGDSVLRGDAMGAHGIENSERFSVVERMRAQLAEGTEASIHDLSMDGMLPADMLAILEMLEARDPEAEVRVALQLSPRHLSRAYATSEAAYSREFLRPEASASTPDLLARARRELAMDAHRFGLRQTRRRLPAALRDPSTALADSSVPGGALTQEQALMRRALHRGRVLPHFLETDSSASSVQVEALGAIGKLLALSGRQALAFSTPIDEAYLLPGQDPAPLLAASAPLRRLVGAGEATGASFLDFNDQLFESRHFLDHCHLTPEGNALLARRLLQALCLPLEYAPSAWETDHELASPAAYVLGDLALGRRDGVGTQVRFGASKQMAEVRPGVLYVSDADNGLLRAVHLASRSCETLFDGRSAGHSGLHAAGFRPGPLVADGAGGAYFLDRHSGLVGHLDRHAALRVVGDGEKPPWYAARERALLGAHAGRIYIIDQIRGIAFVLDSGSHELRPEGQMPALVGARSMAIATDARVWFLDSEGNLQSFLPGFDAAPVLHARADAEAAEVFWQSIVEETSIQRRADMQLLLNDPSEIFISGQRIFLADHYGEFHTCWRFEPESRLAWPLLLPGSDGRSILGPYARIAGAGHWAVGHEQDLFWLSHRDSRLYRFREPLLGRSTSRFGKFRALLSPDSLTFSGLSHGPRQEGHYRIGVFGSSLAGAGYVDGSSLRGQGEAQESKANESPPVLVSTNSLPLALGRALAPLLGDNPHEVRVLDFTLTRASLVEQLVALVAIDPMQLDMALISIDRTSIEVSGEGEVQSLAAQWRRLARGENGLPEIARLNGFVATPVWSPEAGQHPASAEANREALAACLAEILAWCASHQIRPVLVDLRALDDLGGAGFPSWTKSDDQTSSVIEAALAEHCVPWVQVGRRLLSKSGMGHPFSNEQERHLTAQGHAQVASLLAHRLRPMIEADLFAFEALLAQRTERLGSVRPTRLASLLGGTPMESQLAAGFGVSLERTQAFRVAAALRVVAELQSPEAQPWRAALAAFGMGAAALAREGDGVSIRLVRYANHDEYGQGVAEGAETLGSYSIASDELVLALGEYHAAISAERPPPWLREDASGERR